MKGILKEALKETEQEAQDKEERARNIMIFRAKEPPGNSRKAREYSDRKFVEGLLQELGTENIEFDNVIRLGKKEQEKDRPLRFRVKDTQQKSEVMR